MHFFIIILFIFGWLSFGRVFNEHIDSLLRDVNLTHSLLLSFLICQLASNSLHLLNLIHARSWGIRAVRDVTRCVLFAGWAWALMFLRWLRNNIKMIHTSYEVRIADAYVSNRGADSDSWPVVLNGFGCLRAKFSIWTLAIAYVRVWKIWRWCCCLEYFNVFIFIWVTLSNFTVYIIAIADGNIRTNWWATFIVLLLCYPTLRQDILYSITTLSWLLAN